MADDPDQLDAGDKLACGLGFKMNIGNYSSLDLHVSVTVTKRDGETDAEFSRRGWAAARAELERQVAASDGLIEAIRPSSGTGPAAILSDLPSGEVYSRDA